MQNCNKDRQNEMFIYSLFYISDRNSSPFATVRKRNRKTDMICNCCVKMCSISDMFRYC